MSSRISLIAIAFCVAGAAGSSPITSNSFEDIKSRVGVLEERLAEADAQNRRQVLELQDKYESQVTAAKSKTQAMAQESKAIAEEVSTVAKENLGLRAQAKTLREDNAKWIGDFEAWKNNLTTALEVTQGIIDRASKPSSALDVLNRLDSDDAQRMQSQEHASRLSQIESASKSTVSLLATNPVDTPKAILGDLGSGLEEMRREQEGKINAVKEHYEKMLQEEQSLQTKLVAEVSGLKAKLEFQRQLRSQLKDAVKLLEDQRSQLDKQGRAMRLYAQRLSTKKLPEGKVSAKPHNQSTVPATELMMSDSKAVEATNLRHEAARPSSTNTTGFLNWLR